MMVVGPSLFGVTLQFSGLSAMRWRRSGSTALGCCRLGADCGDCGDDGTGWCHQSASNCAQCTGSFDPSAISPNSGGGGGPSPPSPPAPSTPPSLFWSQWMPQCWNRAVIVWLVSDWKITLIRCTMGIKHGGYVENPGAEQGRMKVVVDAAIAVGVYVVIDWHDHHAEQHTNQAKSLFSAMAASMAATPGAQQ